MSAQEDDIISTAAIYRALVRLEEKQDNILNNQKTMIIEHNAFERRISKVENRQNWFMGVIASVGGVIAILAKTGHLQ